MTKVFLVSSSDRYDGGHVVHGVFSDEHKAHEVADEVRKDFYRVSQVEIIVLNELLNMEKK